jgi:hypothetical protein
MGKVKENKEVEFKETESERGRRVSDQHNYYLYQSSVRHTSNLTGETTHYRNDTGNYSDILVLRHYELLGKHT